MALGSVMNFFLNSLSTLFAVLDATIIIVGNHRITWLSVLLGFSALSIIISVFWRGVRK